MRTRYAIAIPALMIALSPLLAAPARAQEGPGNVLGLVPDNAILAGQVHIQEILDFDRLQTVMRSWSTLLGERTEPLIAELRRQYDQSLASFANHVQYCVVYSESYDDNAPVTICRGDFGSEGYNPPSLTHVEVVDGQYMVTGSRRAAAIEELRSGVTGSPRVGGVSIDPGLLAHLVVSLDPEYTSRYSSTGLPTQSVQLIELKVSRDSDQLGGLGLNLRIDTSNPEMAQQIKDMLVAILTNMAQNEDLAMAAGPSIETIQSWFTLEGSRVIFAPQTDGIALLMGSAIINYANTFADADLDNLPALPLEAPPSAAASGAATSGTAEGTGTPGQTAAPSQKRPAPRWITVED